jgi:hypothetical protein
VDNGRSWRIVTNLPPQVKGVASPTVVSRLSGVYIIVDATPAPCFTGYEYIDMRTEHYTLQRAAVMSCGFPIDPSSNDEADVSDLTPLRDYARRHHGEGFVDHFGLSAYYNALYTGLGQTRAELMAIAETYRANPPIGGIVTPPGWGFYSTYEWLVLAHRVASFLCVPASYLLDLLCSQDGYVDAPPAAAAARAPAVLPGTFIERATFESRPIPNVIQGDDVPYSMQWIKTFYPGTLYSVSLRLRVPALLYIQWSTYIGNLLGASPHWLRLIDEYYPFAISFNSVLPP